MAVFQSPNIFYTLKNAIPYPQPFHTPTRLPPSTSESSLGSTFGGFPDLGPLVGQNKNINDTMPLSTQKTAIANEGRKQTKIYPAESDGFVRVAKPVEVFCEIFGDI